MKSLLPNGDKSVRRGSLGPSKIVRLSQLSTSRQLLVRLCQDINYGSINGLAIRDAEPVFNPPPRILLDLKLDSEEQARPEVELADFSLSDEVARLMDRLDELKNVMIERIEVRAGVPRRVFVERRLTEVPR